MKAGNKRLRVVLIAVAVLAVLIGGGIVAALTTSGGPGTSGATGTGGARSEPTSATDARCVPKKLNVSSVLPGTNVSVSPLPGAFDAMPRTQISFLGLPARDLSEVTATGSLTGRHAGELMPYSQGDGASFAPNKPFEAGETVTVNGQVQGAHVRPTRFSYSFTVAHPDPIPISKPSEHSTPPAGSVDSFHSEPNLGAPSIVVDKPGDANVTRGDIFIAPYSGPGSNGPMIVNEQGQLIWMRPLPRNSEKEEKATNLQVESYEGKPVLTWWQGYIPEQGFGLGEEIVADSSYRTILKVKAGNGNLADLHAFHLEQGHTAVLTVFRTIHCDLQSVGGPKDAAVSDSLYQEIDTKTGLVRREWTSVDHVPLSASYSSPEKSSTSWPFDFFHLNSIDPRPDGTTLISSRNTSALYILDTKTGEVKSTIGGKKSSVTMEPGTRTAFQHDATALRNGEISIFDNGGTPFSTETSAFGHEFGEFESRGLIVSLNDPSGTDTLVRELKHPGRLMAGSQGDVLQMANGNWFVGWGQEPYFSEYSPSGKLIYDAHLWAVKGDKGLETQSYRIYKAPWKATPYWPPSIASKRNGEQVQAWASWNGATEVASWRLLGGSSPESLTTLSTAPETNFETTLKASNAPRYVAVQALNAAGAVIGQSPTIHDE